MESLIDSLTKIDWHVATKSTSLTFRKTCKSLQDCGRSLVGFGDSPVQQEAQHHVLYTLFWASAF